MGMIDNVINFSMISIVRDDDSLTIMPHWRTMAH
jgi:hypothetical protein